MIEILLRECIKCKETYQVWSNVNKPNEDFVCGRCQGKKCHYTNTFADDDCDDFCESCSHLH